MPHNRSTELNLEKVAKLDTQTGRQKSRRKSAVESQVEYR